MGWFTKKKKGETTEEELQEVQTQETVAEAEEVLYQLSPKEPQISLSLSPLLLLLQQFPVSALPAVPLL